MVTLSLFGAEIGLGGVSEGLEKTVSIGLEVAQT